MTIRSTRTRRLARCALLVLAAGFLLVTRGSPASASVCAPGFTIRWVAEGTNNLWENADNWEDASTGDHRIPDPSDLVCVEVVGPHFTLVTITSTVQVRGIEAFLKVGVNGTLELAPVAGDPPSVAHGDLQNAGVVRGTGDLTVEGRLDPGTMRGTGVVTVAPSGTVFIGLNVLLDEHRVLVNEGTAGWIAGDIRLKNGARLENRGTLTASADTNVVVDLPSGDPTLLRNTGTFRKTGDAGPAAATTIAVPFDNDGDLEVSVGVVRITGGNPAGDTSTGRFGGVGGGIVEIPSGPYAMGTGSHVNGRVDLSGATLTAAGTVVDAGATLNLSAGTFEPAGAAVASGGTLAMSGGTLQGAGDLTVDGTLRWTGGTITGTGTTSIGVGGVLDIQPGGARTLAFRPIVNAGTITWGDADVNSGGGTSIRNSGSLVATSNRAIFYNIGGAQPTLHNTGTIQKTGGTGDTSLPGWLVENDGVITASTGRIVLNAGDGAGLAGSDGTSTGDYGANGGSVTLTAGTFDIGPGAEVTGGCCLVAGGATLNIAGLTVHDGATMRQTGGTVGGTGVLTVEGSYDWVGGTMADTGTTHIVDGARMDISSTDGKTLSARTIANDGVVEWSGGNVNSGNGGRFLNAGMLSLWSDADFFYNIGGAATLLHNTGTVTKVMGTSTAASDFTVVVDNDGTIDVATGGLVLTNGTGVVSSGVFHVDGTRLELNGSFVVDGAVFEGSCCVELTGTLDVTGARVAGGTTFRQRGTLTGGGTLAVTGTLEWLSGTMTGTGTTQIKAPGLLDISTTAAKTLASRRITAAGKVTWREGSINSGVGALVSIDGALRITGNDSFHYNIGGALPVLRVGPAGTLTKTSTGTSLVTLGLDNDGKVDVQAGTLQVGNAAVGPQTGTSTIAGTLEYTGGTHDLTGPVAFSGPGAVRVTAGTVNVGRANDVATTQVAGGTLALNGNDEVQDVELSAGTLTGTAVQSVAGTFRWTGGALAGTGRLTVAPTGHLEITGAAQKVLFGTRRLVNGGTGTWDAGNISTGGGASVVNTGTLTIGGDNTIAYSLGGAQPSFRNTGTLVKSAGAGGATEVVLPFENDGVVQATAGTIRFRSGGPESTGDFAANGGVIDIAGGTYGLGNGVSFTGCCTRLSGAVLNIAATAVATVEPGASVEMSAGSIGGTGMLRVRGTFTWSGGNMVDGTTEVAAGSFTIAGPAAKALVGRTFVNKATVTWTGGDINTGGGTAITNTKTFVITGDNLLAYNVGGAQTTFVNSGALRKTAANGPGAASTFASLAASSSGTVEVAAGTLAFNGGTIDNTGGVTLRRNGTLRTTGAFRIPATKTLTVEVGGTTPGAGHGRLDAGGPVELGGTLAISRVGGFNPAIGTSLRILAFPSRTGTFATVTGATFGSKRFDVQYSATDVNLVVVAA